MATSDEEHAVSIVILAPRQSKMYEMRLDAMDRPVPVEKYYINGKQIHPSNPNVSVPMHKSQKNQRKGKKKENSLEYENGCQLTLGVVFSSR